MLTDNQFRTARRLYMIIGIVLMPVGIFLLMSDIAKAHAFGALMIAGGALLFHDVRIAKIERKLRLAEGEKKQTNG